MTRERGLLRKGLERGEAHLWLAYEETIDSPTLLKMYGRLLSEDEAQKCGRFIFEADRHRCLVSRALLRTVLSEYAEVSPTEWRFKENRYGRPEIVEPAAHIGLHFNLSHTKGLVACVVALNREVGVDVENRNRRGNLLDVAHRYFSSREVKALDELPEAQRLPRFFTYWTLKESYIKARGMGLALPLHQFSFLLGNESSTEITIEFAPELEDDPKRWQFTFEHLSTKHSLAVAIERETTTQSDVPLLVREVVPLEGT